MSPGRLQAVVVGLVVATVVVVGRASQVMILEAATWEQKARS